jgi:hypothetical protein
MDKRFLKIMVPLLILLGFSILPHGFSFVAEEGQKTYIVDRMGERWDVTQAVSLGFKPEGFQYGIGRDAFDTLDHRHTSDDHRGVSPDLRVIGIVREGEAQAYSVRRLSYHEVANTRVGAEAIAVAY